VTPKRASTELGDAHVFLTGGTGFVGQAILERLLADHPGTTVSLLIRGKGSAGGADRLRTLLRKPVFRTWRDRVGDEAVEKAVAERIRVIDGSLSRVPDLPKDLDLVIHSAASVSFDPPIDQAFDTNVGGAMNLYEALLATGSDPHVVHVSTCYVGGLRRGVQPEASLVHNVDWRAEYAAARAAREEVELVSRRPENLRALLEKAREEHGKQGPQAVSKATEAARVEWVEAQLVDAGRTRAESLGWTDVYTLTKASAERAAEELWAQNGHRLSVVRPTIIESAIQHPFPGWIDGFKVADPLIIAYGRGQLPEFPGLPDSILDLIPVDYVVNTVLAAAANPDKEKPQYFHVSSGASNPLPFHRMFENVNRYFLEHPMPKPGEPGEIRVPTWKFPGGRKVERGIVRREKAAARGAALLRRLPQTPRIRENLVKLEAGAHDLGTLRNFAQLYRAYTQTEIIFDDTNTRALNDAIPKTKRGDRGFDVPGIDWEDYLQHVHFPAITGMTRAYSKRNQGSTTPASAKARPELPERTDVVAVFDLEGTVVDSTIVHQYLWVRSAGFRKAAWPGEFARLVAAAPGYLRTDRRDRGEFIRSFLRRYEGMSEARLEKIVQGGYGDTLRRHLSPDALARIKAHREAGHRTVLVTGSIGLLVEPLTGLFDEVVASDMHTRDGVLTGFLDRPPLVAEARAAWLQRYADQNGFDLSGSYGYGDSHADISWLELVGHPHAVNPDTQLQREAQRRHWRIDSWKRSARSPRRDEIPAAQPERQDA